MKQTHDLQSVAAAIHNACLLPGLSASIMTRFNVFTLCAAMMASYADADTFGNGTIIQPGSAAGGTGAVADLQSDNDVKYLVAKGANMTIGGFAAGAGAINSVYLFAQTTTESGYSGTNALQVNGMNTTIVPADRDYGRWRYTEITGGSFGIDTWAEIAALTVSFNNNDSGNGNNAKDALFDCVYIVVNPTSPIPIHPTWLEDFNGTGQADPMVWSYEVGYQRNNEHQYYVAGASNGWQEGGNFIIEGREESVGGYNYTSASIYTWQKFYWQYGRAQIRAKIPALPGMWPAIWGTGEVGQWPHGGEVDIMEYYQGKILANCAVGSINEWSPKWDSSIYSMNTILAVDPAWKDKYHIWTIQWDDENVRLYVDNRLLNTIPQTWLKNTDGYDPSWGPQYPFKQGFHCWLNLAMGGAGGDPSGTMAAGPQRYLIDYWKIWEGHTGNVAPTDISLDHNEIQEGLPTGTTIGNLSAADADPAEVLSYTLVSGPGDTHNHQFTIPEFVSDNTLSGVLKTSQMLNYVDGATRSIRVRVTDIEGAWHEEVFTIHVIGLPEIDVSTPSIVVPEGGVQTFMVKLRTNPATNITVNVSRQSGDPDITVAAGTSLTFGPTNGTDWQTVTLAAAEDADRTNGNALILCEDGSGTYASITLNATEDDNDNGAPLVDAGPDDTVFFAGNGPWSPAAISPDAWYDAADQGSVIESGGMVSQWNDISGNGYHLTQSDTGKRPAYHPTAWNGSRPALVFDDVDDFLQNATTHAAGTMTLAAVYDQAGTAGSDRAFGIRGNGATSNSTFALAMDNALRYDSGSNGGSISASVGKHLRVATRTNSSQLDHVDGSLNINSSSSLTNIAGSINVGNCSKNGSGPFGSMLVEGVVIIGTVSATDREKLEGYFAHKWGLVGRLPTGHAYKDSAPGASALTVNLNGSVSDPDGDSFTTLWSLVSGPAPMVFGDPGAVVTTARFTVAGTYVLRLTADDGTDVTIDEMTIIVSAPNAYSAWAGGTFTNAFTDIGYSRNPDGDTLTNLQEFAFGTDPTVSDGGMLSYVSNGEVIRHGNPILRNFATAQAPDWRAVFLRRKDYLAAGLSYNVRFSAELQRWTVNGETPTRLTGSESTGDYEAVSVPYPVSVPLQAGGNAVPRFFSVEILVE